jgi:NitT/TauT family transport system permease protein
VVAIPTENDVRALARAAQTKDRPRRKTEVLVKLASIALCIALWQIASFYRLNLGFLTFKNIPAPTEVWEAASTLVLSPKLPSHVGASLFRVLAGYGLAAFLGIGLGLLIGRSRFAEHTLMPPLEVSRPIPAVAWIPLSILMFPSAELSMIFITFTGAVFPILLNTIHGVEGVDRRLVASAQSLGAGRFAIFKEVIVPAAGPSIVTGLTIGMGTSWFCLVSAEMISGQFGIGYYTWEAYTLQNYADIVVGMIFIGVLGMGSSALVKKAGALAMPWRTLK